MLSVLLWRISGPNPAPDGADPRFADRHRFLAAMIHILVLLLAFAVLTAVLSVTIFPNLEPLLYTDPTL